MSLGYGKKEIWTDATRLVWQLSHLNYLASEGT